MLYLCSSTSRRARPWILQRAKKASTVQSHCSATVACDRNSCINCSLLSTECSAYASMMHARIMCVCVLLTRWRQSRQPSWAQPQEAEFLQAGDCPCPSWSCLRCLLDGSLSAAGYVAAQKAWLLCDRDCNLPTIASVIAVFVQVSIAEDRCGCPHKGQCMMQATAT